MLVDWIQEAFDNDAALTINPAGFSFGCVPVFDALKLIRRPLIEVHITNIHQRPEPHRHSLVSLAANGVICGLGPFGYLLAVRAVAEALAGECLSLPMFPGIDEGQLTAVVDGVRAFFDG